MEIALNLTSSNQTTSPSSPATKSPGNSSNASPARSAPKNNHDDSKSLFACKNHHEKAGKNKDHKNSTKSGLDTSGRGRDSNDR